jgi:hypothetical protein
MDRKTHRQVAQYLSSLAALPATCHAARPSAMKPFRPFTRRLPLNPYAPLIKQKKIHPRTARYFEAGVWHGQGFLQDCTGRLHQKVRDKYFFVCYLKVANCSQNKGAIYEK